MGPVFSPIVSVALNMQGGCAQFWLGICVAEQVPAQVPEIPKLHET
jgi:hypothetical protein